MAETVDKMIAKLIGNRGRIVGDHPWAGHSGEIVRVANTIAGPGVVVRLDPGHDVPGGHECYVFHGHLWQPETARRGSGPRIGNLVIKDFPGGRRG